MSRGDKRFVVGASIKAIHAWTRENGILWADVEPVTEARQLRTWPGQGTIVVIVVPSAEEQMPPAMYSAIRTQLSIRRCLGNVIELPAQGRRFSFLELAELRRIRDSLPYATRSGAEHL